MFPERLKKLRLNSALTQSELGEKLGLSARVVGFYEKGERSPNLDTLVSIAKYFEVSTDYLLGLTDTPASNLPNSYDKKIYALSKEDKQQLDLFLDFLSYKAKVK